MTIRETEAKSILRKHKRIDSWFISHYGMNLYRGCTHNCAYCDGRAEGYYVDGEFGEDVTVKVNAIEVLRRELNPKRKRTPFKRSFIMVGVVVGDGYQPNAKFLSAQPLSTMKGQLRTLKGVGKVTDRIILEILETGSSAYYEKLLT